MDSRQCYNEVTHYGQPGRLFHDEMGPYPETLKRWYREGLPKDMPYQVVGGYDRRECVPAFVGLLPGFDRETLTETDEYETYRDSDGVIKKRLRNEPPPAMPQYVEYPIKSRKDWPKFKRRLDPGSRARFPVHWESVKKQYEGRDFPLGINAGSLFGWLRNWMGMEGIALMLYDDPAFVEEAAADLTDCIAAVLEKALPGLDFDFALFWEDMAYKTASLIDPAQYRRIFIPHYTRIVELLHKAGIDILMLDSDGNVEELIPYWLDIGINFIYPMEVAAGMDVIELRRKFGKDLLIGGGMDKRVLTRDRAAIKAMVEEKLPLMHEGGYVPGCDHAIPPDVSWDNYRYYRELLLSVEL